jgi:hypothetical protein
VEEARNLSNDGYEAPALIEYGSVEEWTKGLYAEAINLSVVLP